MSPAAKHHAAGSRTAGAFVGTGAGAIVLLAAAMWLAGGADVHVGKALVAVWLAALPVLGIGALCGWLLGTMVDAMTSRNGSGFLHAEGTTVLHQHPSAHEQAGAREAAEREEAGARTEAGARDGA